MTRLGEGTLPEPIPLDDINEITNIVVSIQSANSLLHNYS